MGRPAQVDVTELFSIHGDVGASAFPAWIARHARRLGLGQRLLGQAQGRLDVLVWGPPDLLDAMALGCSLGPQEVWVDEIARLPGNLAPGAEGALPTA